MSNTIIVKTRGRGRPIKSTPKQREAAADALACCASVCDAVEDVEVFEDKHERAIAIAATSAVLLAHGAVLSSLRQGRPGSAEAAEICAEAEALLRTGWKPGDDVTFTPRRPESETVVDVTPEFVAPTLPTHHDVVAAEFGGDYSAAIESVLTEIKPAPVAPTPEEEAKLWTSPDGVHPDDEPAQVRVREYAGYENPTVDDVD